MEEQQFAQSRIADLFGRLKTAFAGARDLSWDPDTDDHPHMRWLRSVFAPTRATPESVLWPSGLRQTPIGLWCSLAVDLTPQEACYVVPRLLANIAIRVNDEPFAAFLDALDLLTILDVGATLPEGLKSASNGSNVSAWVVAYEPDGRTEMSRWLAELFSDFSAPQAECVVEWLRMMDELVTGFDDVAREHIAACLRYWITRSRS